MPYVYNAQITRVVDGDTVHAKVDLGFSIAQGMKLRLSGINAPELNTPEGKAAREELRKLIEYHPVVVHTIKDRQEKFGRYLAEIITIEGLNVNQHMIEAGHAVAYFGA